MGLPGDKGTHIARSLLGDAPFEDAKPRTRISVGIALMGPAPVPSDAQGRSTDER